MKTEKTISKDHQLPTLINWKATFFLFMAQEMITFIIRAQRL